MKEDAYIGRWVHPASNSPLEMVGRKGAHDLDWFASYIIDLLELGPSDEVLDLCCGNGLITVRVARAVRHVTGVDYSRLLLEQARTISMADNITYLEGNAVALKAVLGDKKFNKAYISAAFQHFDGQRGREVLSGLRRVITPNAKVAISDVPDRACKTVHLIRALGRVLLPERGVAKDVRRFPTMRSRLAYLGRNAARAVGMRTGDSEIGCWWSRTALQAAAFDCGFACAILDQLPQNPHHTYRFDAVLRPLGN